MQILYGLILLVSFLTVAYGIGWVVNKLLDNQTKHHGDIIMKGVIAIFATVAVALILWMLGDLFQNSFLK